MYYKNTKSPQGKYCPKSRVSGKTVSTKKIAQKLSQISTVSEADARAVLSMLGEVMADYMASGRSVKFDGLGSFAARSGRLSATLSRRGKDILLKATSDSTPVKVESTEHTRMTATATTASDSLKRHLNGVETALKRRCNTLSTSLLSLLAGALALLSAILIYKIRKQ